MAAVLHPPSPRARPESAVRLVESRYTAFSVLRVGTPLAGSSTGLKTRSMLLEQTGLSGRARLVAVTRILFMHKAYTELVSHMIKRFSHCLMFVVIALSATGVFAQGSKGVKKQKDNIYDGVFDLKGVKLGDSMDKIKTEFNATCYTNSCSVAYSHRNNKMPSDKAYFAKVAVDQYHFDFEENRLVEMRVQIKSQHYSFAYLALLDKYGKPQKKESRKVQNSYGAAFNNESAQWANNEGSVIYIEEYFPDLETSNVLMMSRDYIKKMGQNLPGKDSI